jgi:hypothetical protein
MLRNLASATLAAPAWMASISAQPNLDAADFNTPPSTMSEQELAAGPRTR